MRDPRAGRDLSDGSHSRPSACSSLARASDPREGDDLDEQNPPTLLFTCQRIWGARSSRPTGANTPTAIYDLCTEAVCWMRRLYRCGRRTRATVAVRPRRVRLSRGARAMMLILTRGQPGDHGGDDRATQSRAPAGHAPTDPHSAVRKRAAGHLHLWSVTAPSWFARADHYHLYRETGQRHRDTRSALPVPRGSSADRVGSAHGALG